MTDGPDDFIDKIKRRDAAEQARTPAQQPRTGTNGAKPGGYGPTGLANETAKVRASTEGYRQTTLNDASFNVGQLVEMGAVKFDDAVAELTSAALSVGLTATELKSWDLPDRALRDGMANPRPQRNGNYTTAPGTLIPQPVLAFDEIEQGFWTARKSLQDIYNAALSRMCAPWSVLACCAARAIATVRPCVTLPDIIGGAGSLNWFGAITASSGGGKGAASATAKLLVKSSVQQRNTGSGEGIVRAYFRPRQGDEPAGMHEALMFMVDEIDSLTAQTKRSGATTMSVLRSAFSGETLGFSYVNNTTPIVESHTYRMTMIVSVQPARAADLLADVDGGTPQRFMWFPGTDERISADAAGGYVNSLTLPKPGEWLYPRTIGIPLAARELILRERVKAMRGRTDALDGHALFVREKFAFALAVLDGRTTVTQEDWELSGIAAQVSDATRAWTAASVAEAVDEEATERGRLQGISSVSADEEKSYRTDAKRARVTALIIKHLKAAGDRGLTKRDEQQRLGRDGRWWPTISEQLQSEGVIREAEKRWYINE